jgi:hypothetical protein
VAKKGGDFAKSGSYADVITTIRHLSEEKEKQTQEKTCKQTRSGVQRYIY